MDLDKRFEIDLAFLKFVKYSLASLTPEVNSVSNILVTKFTISPQFETITTPTCILEPDNSGTGATVPSAALMIPFLKLSRAILNASSDGLLIFSLRSGLSDNSSFLYSSLMAWLLLIEVSMRSVNVLRCSSRDCHGALSSTSEIEKLFASCNCHPPVTFFRKQ